jgi:hypothetical protein
MREVRELPTTNLSDTALFCNTGPSGGNAGSNQKEHGMGFEVGDVWAARDGDNATIISTNSGDPEFPIIVEYQSVHGINSGMPLRAFLRADGTGGKFPVDEGHPGQREQLNKTAIWPLMDLVKKISGSSAA